MKDVLDAMVQAMGEHAIALGTVTDRVTALQQILARQFPEMADELKGRIAADQEQSRRSVYELQVSLAKVRELIAQISAATPNVISEDHGSHPEGEAKGGTKSRHRSRDHAIELPS